MDFTNFALIELAGALEAQRDHERRERRWLLAWRRMKHEPDAQEATAEPAPEPLRPAA